MPGDVVLGGGELQLGRDLQELLQVQLAVAVAVQAPEQVGQLLEGQHALLAVLRGGSCGWVGGWMERGEEGDGVMW
jgi:hypothetical protein